MEYGMRKLRLAHHNNCPRCPVIGAEDIPGDEFYELLWLRFNIRIAEELSRGRNVERVESALLERWLQHARIDVAHIDHIPSNSGAGIMVTLPSGCGMPLIDGNHRAARSLRDGSVFVVTVLDEEETFALLCRSMGIYRADVAWQRMTSSKPHPNDE
jgi:hypothetical protein